MAKLKPEEIKFWLEEARSCEERQRIELIQRNNYPFLINYYEGFEDEEALYPHVSTSRKLSIISEYFPNTNALISEIMYQNPDILVEATKPEAEESEALMKSALQYGFTKADALIENRLGLFDMFYAGYCAIEVNHLVEKTSSEYNLLPTDEELKDREKPQGLIQKTISAVKNVFSPDQAEEKFESELPKQEEAYGTVEKTYVRRWSPLDVPLDWRANVLKDRRYNLKKVWLSKAEFDARYPNFKDRVFASGGSLDYTKHEQEIHNKKVLLYEFQIKKKNNEFYTLIISPSITNEEIDFFKRLYTTNGFNMKIGTLHKYGKLYPIALAQVNKKIQDEMNHYVRFAMETAERNIPKYVIDKKKVKADGETALQSTNINDLVKIDGITSGAVTPLQPTNVSLENKELLALFQQQKEKLWSVSSPRLQGKSQAQFMGELEIQEAGFESKQIDIQEGLRFLIQEELETFKDIIVEFWDQPFFFKVTSGDKPSWYTPQLAPDPNNPEKQIVLNPLTDLLTGDYFIKVDISSALRPNKERRKAEIVDFVKFMLSPEVIAFLQSQGKTVNIEEFKKIAKEFGFMPETLLIDIPQPAMGLPGAPGAGMPNAETPNANLPPEEDARRQAEAERIAKERGVTV